MLVRENSKIMWTKTKNDLFPATDKIIQRFVRKLGNHVGDVEKLVLY